MLEDVEIKEEKKKKQREEKHKLETDKLRKEMDDMQMKWSMEKKELMTEFEEDKVKLKRRWEEQLLEELLMEETKEQDENQYARRNSLVLTLSDRILESTTEVNIFKDLLR